MKINHAFTEENKTLLIVEVHTSRATSKTISSLSIPVVYRTTLLRLPLGRV